MLVESCRIIHARSDGAGLGPRPRPRIAPTGPGPGGAAEADYLYVCSFERVPEMVFEAIRKGAEAAARARHWQGEGLARAGAPPRRGGQGGKEKTYGFSKRRRIVSAEGAISMKPFIRHLHGALFNGAFCFTRNSPKRDGRSRPSSVDKR